jgi:hypothetical protein
VTRDRRDPSAVLIGILVDAAALRLVDDRGVGASTRAQRAARLEGLTEALGILLDRPSGELRREAVGRAYRTSRLEDTERGR